MATGAGRDQQAYVLSHKSRVANRRDGRADRHPPNDWETISNETPPAISSVFSVIQALSIGTLDRLAANAPLQFPNSHGCQNQTSRSFRAALWLAVFLHKDLSMGLLCQEKVGAGADLSRWAPCTVLFLDSRSLRCSGMKNHKDRTLASSRSKSSGTKVLWPGGTILPGVGHRAFHFRA